MFRFSSSLHGGNAVKAINADEYPIQTLPFVITFVKSTLLNQNAPFFMETVFVLSVRDIENSELSCAGGQKLNG